MIVDGDRARDAAQEVWIEVFKSLPGFRGESKLSTWITVIARRTVSRFIAGERRRDFRAFAAECRITVQPPADVPDIGDPVTLGLWTRMMCDTCMTAIMHCLEPETRFIFILRAIVKTDYGEISRIMGIAQAAVRQRYSRARRKLACFGRSECALIDPRGECRCGQKRFIRQTRLDVEFRKYRRLSERLESLLVSETDIPPVDYWRELL